MKLAHAAVLASVGLAACVSTPAPAQRAHNGAAYADFLIGRVANLRDDYDVAADRYFAALARTPCDDALLDGALQATLASGDERRAREAARMAPRVDAPGYAHIIRSIDALKGSRWRLAQTEAAHVEGPATEELVARLLTLWARTASGHVEDELGAFSSLASIRPYGALFVYQQALALDAAGRNAEALAAYDRAAGGGMWLPTAIQRHADLLLREGERARAIEVLDTPQNRANPELNAALARVQAGGPASIAPLTPARGAAIGLYGLAVVYLQESDPGTGLALITLALMLEPDYDSARIAFAQQQSDLGHVELARTTLQRVAPNSPYADAARLLEAWILFDSGAESEAVAMVLAGAGDDVNAKRALADMYRRLERYGEADAVYSELVAQSSDDWRLLFARGVVRERLGRWPDAEADMRRALELAPDQPEVMNYLGYSWVDRGENLQEGLQLISRAVALRPNSGAIIDSLGWAYYRLGDYERALQHLERAVELDPADPTLNDHLGDVYWRVGRRTEARYQWRRALTLEPSDPAAIEAKLASGLSEARAPHVAP